MAKSDSFCNRAEAYEAHDDVPLSPARGDAISDVILSRYSRRDIMRGTLGVVAAVSLFGPQALAAGEAKAVGRRIQPTFSLVLPLSQSAPRIKMRRNFAT